MQSPPTTADVKNALIEIIRKQNPNIDIAIRGTTDISDLGFDSLDEVEFIMRIEDKFEIEIPVPDAIEFKKSNLTELALKIRNKLHNFTPKLVNVTETSETEIVAFPVISEIIEKFRKLNQVCSDRELVEYSKYLNTAEHVTKDGISIFGKAAYDWVLQEKIRVDSMIFARGI